MTVRLIKLALSDAGATDVLGVNLTNQEVLDKTEVGPVGFALENTSGLDILYDICHDYSGNLYIIDNIKSIVIKVMEGGQVRWVAGSKTGFAGNNANLNDVPAASANFNHPKGICCDKYGTLYIADTNNNQIRTIKDGKVNVLAGSAGLAGFVDGNGPTARFDGPEDVAVDKAGVVYVADTGNNAIRKIQTDGSVVTIAGNGIAGNGLADANVPPLNILITSLATCPSQRAMFNHPDNIAVDLQGNVYVWDVGNYRIKKIAPDGQVHLHSGSGVPGLGLGTAPNYAFTCEYTYLYGMDPDESGNLYAVDYRAAGRSRVLKIDFNGRPSVIADFDSNAYNAGPWSICTTPGQAIFVGLTYQ